LGSREQPGVLGFVVAEGLAQGLFGLGGGGGDDLIVRLEDGIVGGDERSDPLADDEGQHRPGGQGKGLDRLAGGAGVGLDADLDDLEAAVPDAQQVGQGWVGTSASMFSRMTLVLTTGISIPSFLNRAAFLGLTTRATVRATLKRCLAS
jgi:hypothetical protein